MQKTETNIPLSNGFNIKITVNLINDLLDIPYNINIKLVSLYFTNVLTRMYAKVQDIITMMCDKNKPQKCSAKKF
jgi:hypothetical protein